MPRTPRHRGPDPEDERAFGERSMGRLREGTIDLSWLLDRGYGISSAAELVGDRYHLTRRQRIAISRCTCSKEARERRARHAVKAAALRGEELWLDGFNVLTAVEAALGGGVILVGIDGCCRDVAGVYSHYHKVEETIPALEAIGDVLAGRGATGCCWWLDRPVDNSGRLKSIIQQVAFKSGWAWRVELVMNPDKVLSTTDRVVCSSDHEILDRCDRWFNLVREVIAEKVPGARILDLGPLEEPKQEAGDRSLMNS